MHITICSYTINFSQYVLLLIVLHPHHITIPFCHITYYVHSLLRVYYKYLQGLCTANILTCRPCDNKVMRECPAPFLHTIQIDLTPCIADTVSMCRLVYVSNE